MRRLLRGGWRIEGRWNRIGMALNLAYGLFAISYFFVPMSKWVFIGVSVAFVAFIAWRMVVDELAFRASERRYKEAQR